jgi:hypothetical protein
MVMVGIVARCAAIAETARLAYLADCKAPFPRTHPAMRKSARTLIAPFLVALLAACSNDSGPYLDVTGGSFVFNFRLATASAGIIVVAERELPEGSAVEVAFEDPAGGPPLVLAEQAEPGARHFSFTFEPLSGIKADVDYLATVRLLDAGGKELERIEKPYRSKIDQSILGDEPLTIGPGYAPNPAAQ